LKPPEGKGKKILIEIGLGPGAWGLAIIAVTMVIHIRKTHYLHLLFEKSICFLKCEYQEEFLSILYSRSLKYKRVFES
jgi:hypothetical protein